MTLFVSGTRPSGGHRGALRLLVTGGGHLEIWEGPYFHLRTSKFESNTSNFFVDGVDSWYFAQSKIDAKSIIFEGFEVWRSVKYFER